MRRLRLLQVLLPAVLIVFVWLVVVALRPRPAVQQAPPADAIEGKGGRNVIFTELEGGDTRLSGDIDSIEEAADGRLSLEGIRELLLRREEGSPLEIAADVGDIAGETGARTMIFENGVTIRDADAGLVLTLPRLEVDESTGEARSTAGLSVEGPALSGTADSLVYGLSGQPTVLESVDFENADGVRLEAARAVLVDGLDDVELQGDVRLTRGEERLNTERMRVERNERGALRRARADQGVDASLAVDPGRLVSVSADSADVGWDGRGAVESLALAGGAIVRHGTESLAAEGIDTRRTDAGWRVEASRSVHVQGVVGGGPAWLRCDALEAQLSEILELRSGVATGRVRFEGSDTRAEAARATLGADDEGGIVLEGAGLRRARLARGRTRVTANRIATDRAGAELDATGEVESTLLAGRAGGAGEGLGLFDLSEAVHFVSQRLRGRDADGTLSFTGDVRAWQGERNLAADRIDLDRASGSLDASGSVRSRFPRLRDAPTVRLEDYVQASAERLEYDDAARVAIYREDVEVSVREGRLESDRLDVILGESGAAIREVRASSSVAFEFRRTEDDGTVSVVTGTADRLVWLPVEQTAWLYGDTTPATVRRPGAKGGTTSGRVLRYGLETGELEVDSGEQGPGRIRTGGGEGA